MFKKLCAVLMAACFISGCSNEEELVTKKAFPEFAETDMDGNAVTDEIFSEYDATIINFWNNGCGTCIEEMPELEELYFELSERNVNLIGVGADSGESDEQFAQAQRILSEKGVTYMNLSPDPEKSFYQEFISEITGYPTTYIVDSEGNMIGSPIIGNVMKQIDTVNKRLDTIK